MTDIIFSCCHTFDIIFSCCHAFGLVTGKVLLTESNVNTPNNSRREGYFYNNRQMFRAVMGLFLQSTGEQTFSWRHSKATVKIPFRYLRRHLSRDSSVKFRLRIRIVVPYLVEHVLSYLVSLT